MWFISRFRIAVLHVYTNKQKRHLVASDIAIQMDQNSIGLRVASSRINLDLLHRTSAGGWFYRLRSDDGIGVDGNALECYGRRTGSSIGGQKVIGQGYSLTIGQLEEVALW